MFRYAILVLVAAATIEVSVGCHSPEHARRKRQVGSFEVEDLAAQVERSTAMREFFTNCLREKAGDIWVWQSVIDVTVLDTQWYFNSDLTNCSGFEDNADCWKNRLDQLLKTESDLMQPSRDCIDEYAINVATGQLRRKRQVTPQTNARCTNFFPNSPQVRAYTTCSNDEVNLTPGRADVDFPSVSQFVAEDVICDSEFSECGANDEELISGNDQAVPDFPYRFEAITRGDSPVRDAVTICNDRVFPLQDPSESRCGEWQEWSTCSATCGPGSRSRIRSCPSTFTGSTQESGSCNEGFCRTSPGGVGQGSPLGCLTTFILLLDSGLVSGLGGGPSNGNNSTLSSLFSQDALILCAITQPQVPPILCASRLQTIFNSDTQFSDGGSGSGSNSLLFSALLFCS
ncbi:unnamed protein product [Clavelina lepadiformis]|uniref:Uncharacterized protein n=1 Tax=Clavelina lepadiformis TaxID=159417 RepID=A0ABP0FZ11_CLALP